MSFHTYALSIRYLLVDLNQIEKYAISVILVISFVGFLRNLIYEKFIKNANISIISSSHWNPTLLSNKKVETNLTTYF